MLAWLAVNFSPGTLLVLAVLCLIVGMIIRGMIRDKKAGKHSCGGSCGSCGACGGGCTSCSGDCGTSE